MGIKTMTVKAEAGNGSISGYAATWVREPDSYGDVIAKGAFAESLEAIAESGKPLPLLWNHDSGDLSSFIGTVTRLEEDDHGLYFEADFDDTDRARRARELAMDGRLCKFSFAYDVLDAATVELEDGRRANELRKLDIHEVSLVMYPANRDTSVVEVKSGRRNSAKDAEELRRIADLAASIQDVVSGLLAEEAEDLRDGADAAKAEEPDTANAEEPEDVAGLLKEAEELLTKEER